ncbi:MAG TPA: 5'/3'-nucleotidase SurE [Polyangiaceae bacterium]|nr:5'/3'-nucleotidase SurE [Polyangiaceae bacterium]
MRPLVLLSNDDGYTAPGLVALHAELAKEADVIVCAPEVNQSATSHSLTLHRVLRLRNVEPSVFAIDGTPADCVYVALHAGTRVLPRRPDLVVSGMNHGPNLGVDVFYSGTVAAAREGAMQGVPAIAVSSDSGAEIKAAAALGARLALELCAWHMASAAPPAAPAQGSSGALGSGEAAAILSVRHAPLLNVNIPPGTAWRVRGTRVGARLYAQEIIFRNDPRGREYLWIGGANARHVPVPGSDTDAYDEGVASVTPLSLDLFAPEHADLAGAIASKV